MPELGVHGIVDMVRVGGEAVALHATAALADEKDFRVAAVPEVLLGPAEVVSCGVGVEHMLRSIRVAHALAVQRVLDAAEQLVPASERFAQMRRVNAVLFDITERLSEAMAREYGRAHDAWLASSAALRREVLREILRGGHVPLDRAARSLGYDLVRRHLALVVWTDDYTRIGAHRLEEVAAAVLAACACTRTLIVPVGGRRVWARGAGQRSAAAAGGVVAAPTGRGPRRDGAARFGVAGFVSSHRQALQAERVATISVVARGVFDYQDLDVVAMLSSDMERAREFVRRELGGLADPGEQVAAVRATLKCYLDVGRSLVEAAALLHVARNTVAYRVQRGSCDPQFDDEDWWVEVLRSRKSLSAEGTSLVCQWFSNSSSSACRPSGMVIDDVSLSSFLYRDCAGPWWAASVVATCIAVSARCSSGTTAWIQPVAASSRGVSKEPESASHRAMDSPTLRVRRTLAPPAGIRLLRMCPSPISAVSVATTTSR
nr:helix-turn-helix domain-containing protein [Nocardia vaccinii]